MIKLFLMLAAMLVPILPTTAVHAAPPAEVAPAGDELSVLLDTIRANRRALVSVNLQLTAEESAAFWPIYDRYDKEMRAIGDRVVALVEDYASNFATLSNEKALQLSEDYLAAEAERLKVRRTYLGEFAKVLPGRTVARFYQLENKMDAVIRYDLAATIPVIEEAQAAPGK